ncbi:MAG TPA: type VI secretion system-associated protein TagF [Desulfobacterales bacterium]|nr:type VI secretion system-associated protein TagF [Desulfobacterales bacterium]
MLGVGKSAVWQWFIAGKHPAAGDFFTLGRQTPMAGALTNWLRQGAEHLTDSRERLSASCSWRFWSQTSERGVITCGLVKNSCDSVGRPFPLLLLGTGPLRHWEENWELLPFVAEGLWGQMEQLTVRNYQALKRLAEDLPALRPPRPAWREAAPVSSADRQRLRETIGHRLRSFEAEQAVFIPLTEGGSVDLFEAVSNLHLLFKEMIAQPPRAVFLGGQPARPALALFNRALNRHDFERLWADA